MTCTPRLPVAWTVRTAGQFCLVWAALTGASLWGSPPPSLPEMLEDAELCDIHFVDPQRGWAVGDRGVIWHSQDGGRNWQLQDSPVSCRLESIWFVDGQQGWIVGGWIHPHTRKSSGVVLHTRDGGRRWTVYSQLTLPALKRVRFVDSRRGWALGNASAMHRTGVFRTEDAGRSWEAVPGGSSDGWLAGDFRDERSGVVAGTTGKIGLVANAQLRPSATPELGIRHLRDLVLLGPVGGWLAGDGGLVMRTTDGGSTWQHPAGRPPAELASHFDWTVIATAEGHCWIAGNPGTRILHTADGGGSWDVLATGHLLPINGMCFLNEREGWICGPLGSILFTGDGGRTWERQRSGGTRSALLGIYSEPERVPLETLALISGEEGFLGAVEVLTRRDLELPTDVETSAEDRIHRAVVSVGGSAARTAWQFPLRQRGVGWSAESTLRVWDMFRDGQGGSWLEAHIVSRIRQWRPEVLLTEAASPRGERPLSHLTNQLVLAAAQKAADPTAYVEQLTVGGLRPWQVKKVFSHHEQDTSAPVVINPAQLATHLGTSLGEQAAYGRALLEDPVSLDTPPSGFRLLISQLPQEVSRQSIFQGISLQSGGEARRVRMASPASNLAELSRQAQRQRNVRQLLSQTGNSFLDSGWLSQMDDLTAGLSGSSGGQLLFQLAERYRAGGKPQLAIETYERLLEQYPNHALAEAAAVRLIQHLASQEATWQVQRQNRHGTHQVRVQPREREAVSSAVITADYRAPLEGAGNGGTAQLMGATATVGSDRLAADRAARAIAVGELLERTRPSLYAEPAVRFPLAVAYRRHGLSRNAESLFHGLAGLPEPTPWSRCADAELWLGQARGIPPKPIGRCVAAPTKPRLDGQLDDLVWQRSRPLELKGPELDAVVGPATARLAYDAEFLYIAVQCGKIPNRDYASVADPRPRDPSLEDRDRVHLFLDVDRDYATWYRLTLDHRGWTGEACLGDKSWNPQWFVASAADAERWTVEAAIAWSELVPRAPSSRSAWAFGIQRIVPDVGVQSFQEPAAAEPRPQDFGLLVFE